MMDCLGRTAEHWDRAYAQGEQTRSWFQPSPDASLRMLDAAGVSPGDSVIDLGGGASSLVDSLLERGHEDVTVLDVSVAALRIAQGRLGRKSKDVQWIVADLLTWNPPRAYAAWHDRAVFHFVTTETERQRYLTTLNAATEPGSVAIFGCFAPGGPQACSGLPVARYSSTDLVATLGENWTLVATEGEEHHTPAGAVQPFTWAAFHRRASAQSGSR